MTTPATVKLILNIGNSGGQFSGPESSLQIRSLADFIIFQYTQRDGAAQPA
jgi:hypothetical protein